MKTLLNEDFEKLSFAKSMCIFLSSPHTFKSKNDRKRDQDTIVNGRGYFRGRPHEL